MCLAYGGRFWTTLLSLYSIELLISADHCTNDSKGKRLKSPEHFGMFLDAQLRLRFPDFFFDRYGLLFWLLSLCLTLTLSCPAASYA